MVSFQFVNAVTFAINKFFLQLTCLFECRNLRVELRQGYKLLVLHACLTNLMVTPGQVGNSGMWVHAGVRGKPAILPLGPQFPYISSRVLWARINFMLLGRDQAIIISELNRSSWRCSLNELSQNSDCFFYFIFLFLRRTDVCPWPKAAPGSLSTLWIIEFRISASCSECVSLARDSFVYSKCYLQWLSLLF